MSSKVWMNFDDFRLNNINMQKFQHAHWPRARQLFPNSAESWNFFSAKTRNWEQKVELNWLPASGEWRVFQEDNRQTDVNHKSCNHRAILIRDSLMINPNPSSYPESLFLTFPSPFDTSPCRPIVARITLGSSNCWFARDVTAAMLVVKNKSLSLLGTKLYFHVNSSRKKFYCRPPTWPPCHVFANQENRVK